MNAIPIGEEAIFQVARKIDAPEARRAYLDQVCGADRALRERLEALLHVHDQERSFLETPPANASLTAAVDVPPLAEGPGTVIGPYKLLQEIGQGGMGAVFMAEQEHPLRRRVALKIIKPGMDSAQVIARFEAERQALALMDHQNIARVLDAGTTATGRPFFVMELVRGVPITEYCDQNRLTPLERLELFIPVCQAIQHAHQKGIIHRDIKPSNVLVTLHDGKPVPKVIDFGIAKAIDQRLTERTLFTQFGAVIGTPEYMSPEQAGMSGLDVDTRSDIYSLGVLLYELLTGSTPLRRETLRQAGFDEMLRRIREEEPPRPSTRLSQSTDKLPSISALRHIEPARLRKLVRGELDWIVMKALEKDRTRRYETASGFARDIERYLNGEPVEAGPPSAWYRLRKYALKHRVGLATAASFALVLIAATVVSSGLAIRATRAEGDALKAYTAEAQQRKDAITQRNRAVEAERQAKDKEKKAKQSESEAKAVLEFFQEQVLAAARPESKEGGLGKDATIRKAVDAAEPKIAAAFKDQPTVEASIRDALGTTYWYLSEPALAIRQHERALALRTSKLGRDHTDTLEARDHLANAYLDAGRTAESIALHKENLTLVAAKLGPDDPLTLTSRNNLAVEYSAAGRTAEAIALHQEVLKVRTSKLGPDDPETLASQFNLAEMYRVAGRTAEAIAMLEENLKRTALKFGADAPSTVNTRNCLAGAYQSTGRTAEAIAMLEENLKLSTAKLGRDHGETLTGRNWLAVAYLASGRTAEAITLLEETLKLYRAKLGSDHGRTLNTQNILARAYLAAGRSDEAIALHEQTLKLQTAGLGHDHPQTLISRNNLAVAYQAAGRSAEAVTLLEETLKLWTSKLGPDLPETLENMNNLAGAYLDVRRWNMAEATARECLRLRERKPEDWWRFHTMSQLGTALAGQKKYAQAEPLLIQGYEGLKAREAKISALNKNYLAEGAQRVVKLYEAWGKPEKAAEWRKRLGMPDDGTGFPAEPFAR
jgi:serine/threonine protein kinase